MKIVGKVRIFKRLLILCGRKPVKCFEVTTVVSWS